MNREEKNRQTQDKILASATAEFAAHGFEAASLNTVCLTGGVSKGIIYHYFISKDGLYLACLKECFRSLTEYLKGHISEETEQEDLLTGYFNVRLDFFRKHENYARIFCGAVIFPPIRLQKEIADIRRDFDEMNDNYLRKILRNRRLRSDLSEEEIIRAFRMMQDSLNASYHHPSEAGLDIARHENDCRNLVNIFLYGILERKEK
jgi:AcrR family transcriptional regulator